MTMTDLLWKDASRDIDAEAAQMAELMAKQATAHLWTFLGLAQSEDEFEHRLAMVTPEIEQRVAVNQRTNVVEGFRDNYKLARQFRPDDDEGDDETDGDDGEGLDSTAGLAIWHHASQQWVMAAAEPTPGNPAYFSGGPELGPNTGETGTYPTSTSGPDPWNPMNAQYPMQPSQWMVPQDKQWGENPMQFQTGPGVQYRHAANGPSSQYTPNPGWQQKANPDYFGQGQEGVASQVGGYPEDIALPEPDERVDLYQNMGPSAAANLPNQMSPEFSGPPVQTVNYPQYVTGAHHEARTNVGSCAADGCGRPVYRDGKKWHHLDPHLQGAHNVLLQPDHPYVLQQQAARQSRSNDQGEYRVRRCTGGGYAVFDRNGYAMSATAMSYNNARIHHSVLMGDSSQATPQRQGQPVFIDTHVAAQESAPEPSGGGGSGAGPATQGTKPPAPPSMHPGGPGAQAMPSMQSHQAPSNVPQPAAAPGHAPNRTAARDPHVAAFFRHADTMVRERPSDANPSGIPDEYTERTWDGAVNTRPRQPSEERGVNTPQRPPDPIAQNSSDTMQRDEEER